jgi:pSer/pThr/pTyr-binding forkhead associated (FHA) protein
VNAWSVTLELSSRSGGSRVLRVPTIRDGEQDVVSFGRVAGNQVVLANGNVSKRHCRLKVSSTGDVVIEDRGSSNGTWVNGRKVTSPMQFGPSDKLYLGDHVIRIVEQPVPYVGWQVALEIIDRGGGTQHVTARATWVDDDRHEITIGRAGDVALENSNASRVHCKLIINDAGFTWISDCGSSNGTYVDGEKIAGNTRFPVGARAYVGNNVVRLAEPPTRART